MAMPSLGQQLLKMLQRPAKRGEHQHLLAAALPQEFQESLILRRAVEAPGLIDQRPRRRVVAGHVFQRLGQRARMAAGGQQQRAELPASQRRQPRRPRAGAAKKPPLSASAAVPASSSPSSSAGCVAADSTEGRAPPPQVVRPTVRTKRPRRPAGWAQDRLGIAGRQVHLHQAPRVADHHLAQQRPQPLAVARDRGDCPGGRTAA